MESDCESGSKGSSARHTNRPDASQRRTGNSDGGQVGLPGGRDVTRSATQLLPLLEEALIAVETRARATSERKGRSLRHGADMLLEPLREEVVMAVESCMEATSKRWKNP